MALLGSVIRPEGGDELIEIIIIKKGVCLQLVFSDKDWKLNRAAEQMKWMSKINDGKTETRNANAEYLSWKV